MPRKNRRNTPESKHHLDHWADFCRKTIAESKKKMSVTGDGTAVKKKPAGALRHDKKEVLRCAATR